MSSLRNRSPYPEILGLPACTAPARLKEEWGEVDSKRKCKIAGTYFDARAAGLPPWAIRNEYTQFDFNVSST
jgi:hypothetical protein